MDERAPVIVVDRCEASAERGHFLMKAVCAVCGETHVALFSRGQTPFHAAQMCPGCGLASFLRYHPTKEAIEMLDGRRWEVWLQSGDGIGPVCTRFPLLVPMEETADLDDVLSGPRGEV